MNKNNITIAYYSKESLETIKQSSFLSKEDFEQLTELREELQDTFEKKQMWRTETEMRVSVLNDIKFPTNAAKYWQSVREQSVFFENLVTLSFDYRRNNIKIRKLLKEINETKDEFEKDEKQVDLDEALYLKKNMELAAKDRMREIKLWSKIKKELDDNTFDVNNVNTHQLISYGQRFVKMALNLRHSQSANVGEVNNVLGQMITTLKIAEARGVTDKIFKALQLTEQKEVIDYMKNMGVELESLKEKNEKIYDGC